MFSRCNSSHVLSFSLIDCWPPKWPILLHDSDVTSKATHNCVNLFLLYFLYSYIIQSHVIIIMIYFNFCLCLYSGLTCKFDLKQETFDGAWILESCNCCFWDQTTNCFIKNRTDRFIQKENLQIAPNRQYSFYYINEVCMNKCPSNSKTNAPSTAIIKSIAYLFWNVWGLHLILITEWWTAARSTSVERDSANKAEGGVTSFVCFSGSA